VRPARHTGGIQLPHDTDNDHDYGKGSISVGKDLEAVLRKIEHWHQAPVTKFRIMARQGQGTWHGVRWDGKTAISFPLDESDEAKDMQALLLQHPFEEPQAPPTAK
jgi:hypothetical protein